MGVCVFVLFVENSNWYLWTSPIVLAIWNSTSISESVKKEFINEWTNTKQCLHWTQFIGVIWHVTFDYVLPPLAPSIPIKKVIIFIYLEELCYRDILCKVKMSAKSKFYDNDEDLELVNHVCHFMLSTISCIFCWCLKKNIKAKRNIFIFEFALSNLNTSEIISSSCFSLYFITHTQVNLSLFPFILVFLLENDIGFTVKEGGIILGPVRNNEKRNGMVTHTNYKIKTW